ncbi:MAG: hypothetical protein IKU82_01815, partial [Clostridia bacterium]|nr:hypothetical protein [Clostridia bacterium]
SNEEVFAEEKRKREEEEQKREAEREKMRKRREMCGSCQNNAGCLAKGNVDFCPRFVPYRY